MRKKGIFVLLLLSTLIFFTACSKENTEIDINYILDCTADIEYKGEKINCNLYRQAPSRASIQILSPNFNGLTYYWSGKDFSISYNGLSAKSTECLLPQTSFAVQLMKVIDFAEQNKSNLDMHGNQISGNINGSDFTITADRSTGLIKSIKIPSSNISAELYDHN